MISSTETPLKQNGFGKLHHEVDVFFNSCDFQPHVCRLVSDATDISIDDLAPTSPLPNQQNFSLGMGDCDNPATCDAELSILT
ncbi:hypothetical protein RRSWK_05679 [Rhodopirellula sp. SWK7]|nr:hypothetical protein RRSWK_05679 [Rhodopirellula sp. SWK7]